MEDYKKILTTPGSQNWLKGSVAVNITKQGLASFACNVCDEIRTETLKIAIKHLVPDLCENCSIVEVIPCDPNNNICNAGQCRFHKSRMFRPCLIIKCNDYRNTVPDKIHKRMDIGLICNSCRTVEIVQCNPRNKVCDSGRCKFHMDQNTKILIPTRPCPNNICDTLRDVIEQKHRFGKPSWKNTDARKWCVNAWDIAKCFMPPDGYADVDNEDDTDLNGIISVYINCKEFEKYFTADLSLQPTHQHNLCTKVRDVGRHIRHAPKLEVTDDKLKVWFTDLKALLSDPTFHKANPRAQNAIDQLDKLESDDYVIPLLDIKTELEWLKREATDLGDVLQSKTDEGVRAIHHAENNAIQNITSLNEYDQPLSKSDLIKFYREDRRFQTLGHGLDLADSGLEDIYIPPNISRVDLQSIHSDKTPNDHTTEPLENLKQLFSSKGIIFLTADAGVGKTSFCKFLVLSWCKVQEESADLKSNVSGTQTVLSDIEYLKEFSYLFYINCHKNQRDTLEDIIFSHTVSVHTKLTKDDVTFRKNTHLELSGLTHLSKITIQNIRLSQVTINPSCLEEFWVYVKPEMIQEITPMKLSFVSGSQFSSNLKKLSLVHVTMDVPLDLANCPQLQQLVIENTSSDSVTDDVTFRKNTHLELSGLTHLSKITIQNIRLSQVTINPSCLEEFWVAVKTELIQEIPPVKLSFVGGSQFSSNLKKLSLVHVTMDVRLDLANCQQLVMENTSSDSVTDDVTFRKNTHLELSGLTHLSKITIQNIRLSRVTINPSCLEKFWVYVKPELILEILPMKLSFDGGSKFSSKLTDLSLMTGVKKVEFEEVKIVKAQQLVALLTCTEPIQASDNTAGGMVELPDGLRVSDISFSECPVLGSTVEELDSAIECLRRVWEIKEVKIETQQSSISNTVCGEDIISENHIVLKSLQLNSN
ncbi:uncharacterized protein LOC128205022 [Mya arenaria]|uniref:uncharacterized protein LOC128205022 n=1 Tax=Mya arenaria TaxID=6604 RepID=UPI0022E258BC|nr:uncharacterized protein LOC128205022 [Mya arenaria]